METNHTPESSKQASDSSEPVEETPQKNPAKEIVDWLEGVKKSTDSEVLIDVYDSVIQDIRKFWLSPSPEPCQFEPRSNTSSGTICKHCGLEKWQHEPEPKEK